MKSITRRHIALAVYRLMGPVLALLITVLCAAPVVPQTTSLTVAAAADLQPALRELAAQYEKNGAARLALVFGSSGNLATQMKHGAPYDVFMSADMDYPRRLEGQGLAVLGSLTPYAVGTLVLWAPKTSAVDVRKLGFKALTAPEVRAIAIANPEHAPYGKAAVAALRRVKLYETLKSRLVLGENVAQAAQFVASGNAQVGIISMSLALAPEFARTGKWWELPPDSYPAITQGAVVLRKSNNQKSAEQFIRFLKSAEAAAIFRRHGFKIPEEQR